MSDEKIAVYRAAEVLPVLAEVIAQRDQLLSVARDFDEALRELGLHCECGQADCRTTRLRAALTAVGGAQ